MTKRNVKELREEEKKILKYLKKIEKVYRGFAAKEYGAKPGEAGYYLNATIMEDTLMVWDNPSDSGSRIDFHFSFCKGKEND